MRQSNVIFATLIFTFVLYITMRGQLPAYLDLFKSKKANKSEKGESLDQADIEKMVELFGQ